MTSNNANRFLGIEETANELIQVLQELESNVRSYAQVGGDLEEASQGLSKATAQFIDVASQIREVATSMRNIGMPGLFDAVREATTAVEQAQQRTIDGLREAVVNIEANQRRDARQIKLAVIAGFVFAGATAVLSTLILP